jgi:hypothetical protein
MAEPSRRFPAPRRADKVPGAMSSVTPTGRPLPISTPATTKLRLGAVDVARLPELLGTRPASGLGPTWPSCRTADRRSAGENFSPQVGDLYPHDMCGLHLRRS